MTVALDSLQLLSRATSCTAERMCAEIARIFGVRKTEIGLLRLQGAYLKFVFPIELRTVGAIPLVSSAVAAKTAVNKSAEIFNNFVQVKHASIFEMVRLGTRSDEPEMDDQTIQKLMTMAILDDKKQVLGVLQVSRKGATRNTAGPDFTDVDLHTLLEARPAIARIMLKLIDSASLL
jgi:hypothetical protein